MTLTNAVALGGFAYLGSRKVQNHRQSLQTAANCLQANHTENIKTSAVELEQNEADFSIISWAFNTNSTSAGALEDEQTATEISALLDQVLFLLTVNRPDEACDRIYDKIDSLLEKADYRRCNELLIQAMLNIDKFSLGLTRLILCLTIKDKAYLPRRATFWNSAYKKMTASQGASIADRLIGHLR